MIERKKVDLSVLDFKAGKNASSCSLFQVNTSPKGFPKARCFYATLCEGNIPSSPSRSFTGSSLSIGGTRYRAFFLPMAHTDCGRVGRSIKNRGPEFASAMACLHDVMDVRYPPGKEPGMKSFRGFAVLREGRRWGSPFRNVWGRCGRGYPEAGFAAHRGTCGKGRLPDAEGAFTVTRTRGGSRPRAKRYGHPPEGSGRCRGTCALPRPRRASGLRFPGRGTGRSRHRGEGRQAVVEAAPASAVSSATRSSMSRAASSFPASCGEKASASSPGAAI